MCRVQYLLNWERYIVSCNELYITIVTYNGKAWGISLPYISHSLVYRARPYLHRCVSSIDRLVILQSIETEYKPFRQPANVPFNSLVIVVQPSEVAVAM